MVDALLYCEAGLDNLLGKTTHGLLRYSPRFNIVGVIDSDYAWHHTGEIVEASSVSVPIWPDLLQALANVSIRPDALIIGVAPTGYGSFETICHVATEALRHGLSVYNGLHQFLSKIPEIAALASERGVSIVDIRKPPDRPLAMFSGEINRICQPRVVVIGQDAAVGKRTTCFRLAKELGKHRIHTCVIGTGQTSWLQGCEYGVRLDALPMDFAAGELEREILRACDEVSPDLLIIEGQGSLLNPGYAPETMVILTAARPQAFVYVLAPERTHYDDFPEFKITDPLREVALIEAITGAWLAGCVARQYPREGTSAWALVQTHPTSIGITGDLSTIGYKILELLAPHAENQA